MLAGADDNQVKSAEQIAHHVGMAFQIRDDILDVISTTEELGKPVKSDEKNNKTTYVTIYGIDGASKLGRGRCSYSNDTCLIRYVRMHHF